MINLEIKVKLDDEDDMEFLKTQLSFAHYSHTFRQKDTYFEVESGKLKLREEFQSIEPQYTSRFIRYLRPIKEEAKISNYEIYPIEDLGTFKSVFGCLLNEEAIIEKTRELYLYENARIHLDTVKDLGYFLEIEIVINNDDEKDLAPIFMEFLIERLELQKKTFIDCGYRDLMLDKIKLG